ncbi:MAG: toll/interleukin-1 receptor domain-containing protein [Pseudomonadota bacterium]|nr:toll/interleukin-1 receptor domain-containing protein [Pseudomonadota bacterium]
MLIQQFKDLVNQLVTQQQDQLSQKNSERRKKILKDSASRGWDIPPGHIYGELDELQVKSLQDRGDIVWRALEETLRAFDPPYYPELAAELKTLAESFFSEHLCEPQDYLRGAGWKDPWGERSDEIRANQRHALEGARRFSLYTLKTKIDLYVAGKRRQSLGWGRIRNSIELLDDNVEIERNVFICHASEDKDEFVRPLATALQQRNLNVWYDEFFIEWGDSIRQSIDRGLASCKFGVVVFSRNFFEKKWPQRELDALYERMVAGEARMLPIWHGLSANEMQDCSPLLAGVRAESSSQPIEELVIKIEAMYHSDA